MTKGSLRKLSSLVPGILVVCGIAYIAMIIAELPVEIVSLVCSPNPCLPIHVQSLTSGR
jgi:hypothetical protein